MIAFLPRPSLSEFQKGETVIASRAISQKQEVHVGNWPLTFEELLQGLLFPQHIHGAGVLLILPPRTRVLGAQEVRAVLSTWSLQMLLKNLHFLFIGAKPIFCQQMCPERWLGSQNDYKTRICDHTEKKKIHGKGSGNKSIYLTVGNCFYSAFRLCFKDLCP